MATRCSSLPESLFPSVWCKTLGFLNENLITTLCFFRGDNIPVWPVICHLLAFPPASFPPHGSLQPPPNVCRSLSRPGSALICTSPPLWQTSLLHIRYATVTRQVSHVNGQTVPASPFPRGECPSVLISQPLLCPHAFRTLHCKLQFTQIYWEVCNGKHYALHLLHQCLLQCL